MQHFTFDRRLLLATENNYTKEMYLKIEVSEEFHFTVICSKDLKDAGLERNHSNI